MTMKEELAKVEEAVSYYMKGAIKRDFEHLAKGWHDEAKMFGLDKENNLVIYDKDFWKKSFEKPIDDPNYKRTSEILSVDIVGTIASAKVKTVVEHSKGSVIFMDLLNLLKIDDSWQIVNKIYDATYE
ncbi:MAG: nuclear transport factor 2 family protein [Candidatus Heimdallarchaeota archaeon]|nr:nuclear transport factor 2 family protein [Candidatus Heimdallarchaeota archaeon]MBY8995801.1 nuclear transport factor 2 family protein [Candidatus Heimdallarchaeota archaeon]